MDSILLWEFPDQLSPSHFRFFKLKPRIQPSVSAIREKPCAATLQALILGILARPQIPWSTEVADDRDHIF